MKYVLIEQIKKITEEDIKKYAEKEGLYLLDEEIKIINNFIKENADKLSGNNVSNLIQELEGNIRKETYEKIVSIVEKYKRQFKLN